METATPDNEHGETTSAQPATTTISPRDIHRFSDTELLAQAAAKRFLDVAKRAVDQAGRFTVALSGGSTPRALYRVLTEEPYRNKVPWAKAIFLFGDERCVGPDDEQSNYRMAKETLFDPLEISPHRVLRMKGEQPPAEAASRYAVRLDDLFLGEKQRHLDLVLLGVGEDGHTASLFPGTAALDETERWVVANQVPQLEAWRLTLTYPALCSAKRVLFLVTGEEKADVVARAFGGEQHDEPYPCERVVPINGRRELLVDRAAASKIPVNPAAAATD